MLEHPRDVARRQHQNERSRKHRLTGKLLLRQQEQELSALREQMLELQACKQRALTDAKMFNAVCAMAGCYERAYTLLPQLLPFAGSVLVNL